MIDKDLFPKEYAAIEGLKRKSEMIERDLHRKRNAKQEMIELCRRALDEQKHSE